MVQPRRLTDKIITHSRDAIPVSTAKNWEPCKLKELHMNFKAASFIKLETTVHQLMHKMQYTCEYPGGIFFSFQHWKSWGRESSSHCLDSMYTWQSHPQDPPSGRVSPQQLPLYPNVTAGHWTCPTVTAVRTDCECYSGCACVCKGMCVWGGHAHMHTVPALTFPCQAPV